jgi:hypothetical protein
MTRLSLTFGAHRVVAEKKVVYGKEIKALLCFCVRGNWYVDPCDRSHRIDDNIDVGWVTQFGGKRWSAEGRPVRRSRFGGSHEIPNKIPNTSSSQSSAFDFGLTFALGKGTEL